MIPFRVPVLEDRTWVEERFCATGNRGCEYSFATMFLWARRYCQHVARWEDFVLERLCGSQGVGYLFPVGGADLAGAVDALERDAAERGHAFRFFCVTGEQVRQLEQACPGRFRYELDRDGFDYLYGVDKLADLNGKKLHAKRNHINRFIQDHPDWTVEPITPDNLVECMTMDMEWNRRYRTREEVEPPAEDTLKDESQALARAFANYGPLRLRGLLLRTEGQVVAFTMGSPICRDTFDIHFEKAFGEMRGAYTLINREFARWIREHEPEVRFLNREDDMGLPGLRKAKESYDPDQMVEKYTVLPREA